MQPRECARRTALVAARAARCWPVRRLTVPAEAPLYRRAGPAAPRSTLRAPKATCSRTRGTQRTLDLAHVASTPLRMRVALRKARVARCTVFRLAGRSNRGGRRLRFLRNRRRDGASMLLWVGMVLRSVPCTTERRRPLTAEGCVHPVLSHRAKRKDRPASSVCVGRRARGWDSTEPPTRFGKLKHLRGNRPVP
jgi:hypothetical protein